MARKLAQNETYSVQPSTQDMREAPGAMPSPTPGRPGAPGQTTQPYGGPGDAAAAPQATRGWGVILFVVAVVALILLSFRRKRRTPPPGA